MKLETISESRHKELLSLLNPLVDFLVANKYNYFIVAGKGGTCTRHMRGQRDDVSAMITGMMENNPQFRGMMKSIVNDFKDNHKKL